MNYLTTPIQELQRQRRARKVALKAATHKARRAAYLQGVYRYFTEFGLLLAIGSPLVSSTFA